MAKNNKIEFQATTIEQYCKVINEIKATIVEAYNSDKKQNLTRITLWYRGQENKEWKIMPSIHRDNLNAQAEQVLCHSFYHRVSQVLPTKIPRESYDQWISLMQHYGLPTRLLDWSYSPLVALFFAIVDREESNECDACITVIAPELLNEMQSLGRYIYPIDSQHALNMLRIAFKKENVNDLNGKIMAVFPTSNDLRIYAQKAAFTIHDTEKTIYDVCENKYIYRIIIPKDKKEYFRNILTTMDFTESMLFPDIEHIAQHVIARHGNKK